MIRQWIFDGALAVARWAAQDDPSPEPRHLEPGERVMAATAPRVVAVGKRIGGTWFIELDPTARPGERLDSLIILDVADITYPAPADNETVRKLH